MLTPSTSRTTTLALLLQIGRLVGKASLCSMNCSSGTSSLVHGALICGSICTDLSGTNVSGGCCVVLHAKHRVLSFV